jgi:putative nucleotidyltransferase with HDIG domain
MPLSSRKTEEILDLSQLPSLPQTLVELIEACNDHEVNLPTVADIVARDPVISARILQLANSAFLGSRSSFADIEQAVIYLGIDTVRNLAISVSVHEAFQSFRNQAGLSLARFWHHSLLTAVLAKTLAQLSGYPHPAEAYLAGLLHDLGKLLLSRAFPDAYGHLLNQGPLQPAEFASLEKKRLGLSHAEAGSLLVSRWNLKTPIAEAIELHHQDEKLTARMSSLATLLFLANSLSLLPPADIGHAKDLARQIQINPEALFALFETAEETVTAIAEGMGITIERPTEAAVEDSPHDNGHQELVAQVESLTRLHGMLDNLIRAESCDRICKVIEESMHILFDIRHCLIFFPKEAAWHYEAHGSAANPLMAGSASLSLAAGDFDDLIAHCHRCGDGFLILTDQETGEENASRHALHAYFASPTLFFLPLLSGDWRGIVVAAIEGERAERFNCARNSLSSFARHSAARLHLDALSRQRAEQLAGQRVDTVQKIAKNIAHEINNPLSVVENYLSILASRLADRQGVQEELRTISEEVSRIAQISRQLEDLTAPPAPVAVRQVDLNLLVRETLGLFENSLFQQRGIAVRLDCDSRIPEISTDPGALRQILSNLLNNAAEALTSGNTVRVGTGLRKDPLVPEKYTIEIVVEDDGPGIPHSLGETLFSAGVTGKGQGHLGLGLAIVRKLVAELAGTVSCRPSMKKGTCFIVSLQIKN